MRHKQDVPNGTLRIADNQQHGFRAAVESAFVAAPCSPNARKVRLATSGLQPSDTRERS